MSAKRSNAIPHGSRKALLVSQGVDGVNSGCAPTYLGADIRKPYVPLPRTPKSKQTGRRSAGNRVLLVGRMRELALYRAEVLTNHGFRVSIPSDVAEATALIKRGDFEIAVLCYTLSNETVQELADLVRGYCPNCPLITISEKRWVDRRIDPDEVVIAEEGPAGLIAALHRVSRCG